VSKTAGGPVTPARVPSSTSCCTVAWYVPLLTQCSKAGRSSPTSWAEAFNCSPIPQRFPTPFPALGSLLWWSIGRYTLSEP
jgi:hypothetical protein